MMSRNYIPRAPLHELDWILHPRIAAGYNRETYTREEPYFPCGVVGQRFFPHEWPIPESTPTWVHLRPMPENVHDDCALQVMSKGRQIGWVPTEKAYLLAPFIYLLQAAGSACKVPLTPPHVGKSWDSEEEEFKIDVDIGVMVLPKREALYELFPPAILFSEFDRVWNSLTDEERASVRKANYRFDEASGDRFAELGRQLTRYPFVLPVESDSLIEEYLVWYRRKCDSYSKQRAMAKRNLWICGEAAKGRTYRMIAADVGLAQGTVGGIKRQGDEPEQIDEWLDVLAEFPSDDAGMAAYVIDEHF